MTNDIWKRSATDLAAVIRSKDLSANEVLDAHLARIDEANPDINAIVTLSEDVARAQADAVDAAIAKGK